MEDDMKLGSETGSLINHVMSRESVKPEIGMGATILCWSDRHAATIIKMTPKSVTVQRDKAIRTDKNGMSESQDYTYERNENGSISTFRLTKRGWRNKSGEGLRIGDRREYYDYSF
jgi:hypothetical protein